MRIKRWAEHRNREFDSLEWDDYILRYPLPFTTRNLVSEMINGFPNSKFDDVFNILLAGESISLNSSELSVCLVSSPFIHPKILNQSFDSEQTVDGCMLVAIIPLLLILPEALAFRLLWCKLPNRIWLIVCYNIILCLLNVVMMNLFLGVITYSEY